MSSFIRNQDLVIQMRQMAESNGYQVIPILEFLVNELKLTKNARLPVISYLREAFSLELKDAVEIGAWIFFEGGTWGSEKVEARFGPLIKPKNK